MIFIYLLKSSIEVSMYDIAGCLINITSTKKKNKSNSEIGAHFLADKKLLVIYRVISSLLDICLSRGLNMQMMTENICKQKLNIIQEGD
jgi:hypothetical protein